MTTALESFTFVVRQSRLVYPSICWRCVVQHMFTRKSIIRMCMEPVIQSRWTANARSCQCDTSDLISAI
ncbi:hypothetical protein EG68_01991 [Paragonimus skrjabini miyazakii]|uniref:Uncharacterized protein n=1 Tax=Paragonimus skrjabini miyazakii TaxID=59628 RepID=A0A8S9Z546_9TREM|nr:hypothetical protein EG68_01991 [Paragonimus skrjabini miyazakii]